MLSMQYKNPPNIFCFPHSLNDMYISSIGLFFFEYQFQQSVLASAINNSLDVYTITSFLIFSNLLRCLKTRILHFDGLVAYSFLVIRVKTLITYSFGQPHYMRIYICLSNIVRLMLTLICLDSSDSDYSHIYGRLPIPTRGVRKFPAKPLFLSHWEQVS